MSSITARKRIAVIGGGLTGLAAAHRLLELIDSETELDLTLFERQSRTGGVIETLTTPDGLIELGADAFITNKPAVVSLCERIGLGDDLIPTEARYRGAWILHNGKPVPVPKGFQLMLPTDVDAVIESPLLSDEGRARFMKEPEIPPRTDGAEETVAEFVRRRFGTETLQRLVQPLVGGIYTADPERLSLRATLPRFIAQEQKYGSLTEAAKHVGSNEADGSGARYGLFAGLRHGSGSLLARLRRQIDERATVRTDTPIRSLVRDGSGYRLELADGPPESFDAVIIALPTHAAARIVRDFDPDLSQSLAAIEYASTAIAVTTHRLDDFDRDLDAFGLVIPFVERRKVLAVSFSSNKFPGRMPEEEISLRTFIGGATQPELLDHTDEELISIVREELTEMLGLTRPERSSHLVRWNNSMPQYLIGHEARVKAIEERAAKHPNLFLAGNAYHGVGMPDAVMSGENAAERFVLVTVEERRPGQSGAG